MAGSRVNGIVGAVIGASLLFSSTAVAAASNAAPAHQQVNPWAALAVMSGSAPAAALCGSAALVAAAQTPVTGCVLPVTQAPPVAAAQGEPPAPIPVPPVEAASAGLGVSPLLLALGAIIAGVGVYFLVRGHSNSPA
jgi:hypothetical protein